MLTCPVVRRHFRVLGKRNKSGLKAPLWKQKSPVFLAHLKEHQNTLLLEENILRMLWETHTQPLYTGPVHRSLAMLHYQPAQKGHLG